MVNTLLPLALWTKKVGGNRLTPGKKHIKHGTNGWAEFEGKMGREQFYFNAYLPEETPWENRWMTLSELRKTPKPVHVDDESRIGPWLRKLVAKGRVVLIGPVRDSQKTESTGHRPDPKTATPIGTGVYA